MTNTDASDWNRELLRLREFLDDVEMRAIRREAARMLPAAWVADALRTNRVEFLGVASVPSRSGGPAAALIFRATKQGRAATVTVLASTAGVSAAMRFTADHPPIVVTPGELLPSAAPSPAPSP